MENRNYYTITLSLLGVLKLVLNAFGMDLVTDKNANEIANAVATILSIVGVIMAHVKSHPKISFKQYVVNLFAKFKKKPADIPAEVENVVMEVTPIVKTVETLTETKKTASPAEQPKEEDPAAPATPTSNNTVQK
jgi:uncharacterized protein YebE (UPF0316 family)